MLQEYNPKNKNILVYVGDKLYKREEAKVSVFDSTVQNGDAVWEGLRVYPEGIVCLDKHLTRIHEGAKALAYEGVPSKEEIKKAIKQTLDAMGRKRAARKMASKDKLEKRAMRQARDAVVKKITKDIPKGELSFARRQEIEKI